MCATCNIALLVLCSRICELQNCRQKNVEEDGKRQSFSFFLKDNVLAIVSGIVFLELHANAI